MSLYSEAASLMGKCSYAARVERLGIERDREIARESGKKGGRPSKVGKKARVALVPAKVPEYQLGRGFKRGESK